MSEYARCDCGHSFPAADSAAGGYVNCPHCGKAVAVPGLRDPLWLLLQAGAILLWVGVVYLAVLNLGTAAGLLIGLGLAGLLWLISRAF